MKELETPEMNKLYKEFGNEFVKILTKELISSSKSVTEFWLLHPQWNDIV